MPRRTSPKATVSSARLHGMPRSCWTSYPEARGFVRVGLLQSLFDAEGTTSPGPSPFLHGCPGPQSKPLDLSRMAASYLRSSPTGQGLVLFWVVVVGECVPCGGSCMDSL